MTARHGHENNRSLLIALRNASRLGLHRSRRPIVPCDARSLEPSGCSRINSLTRTAPARDTDTPADTGDCLPIPQ
jgi:hypothetical protein